MNLVDWLVLAAALAAVAVADLRWLRVAQREHYVPGEASTFARLWLVKRPMNAALAALAVVALIAGFFVPIVLILCAAIVIVWPLGLGIKGAKPLVFTARVKRLLAAVALLQIVVVVTAVVAWLPLAMLAAALTPLVVDAALAIMVPIETSLASRFVRQAEQNLAKVNPTVVGITGSYGKTSTKLYVDFVLSQSLSVVASPGSFNNLMGLSRTINDQLRPGAAVLVAEMGTYGPGEIRKLCAAFPPTVAVITSIGEAHLSRMKDRATIVRAKSEITESAPKIVLNIDEPELADLADVLAADRVVVRCSTQGAAEADVVVAPSGDSWRIVVRGEEVLQLPAQPFGHPINLACALGVALALEVPVTAAMFAHRTLPSAPHRAELVQGPQGIAVIDDTYNSNPTGAAHAVRGAAARIQGDGRLYVVTPGMVELGTNQVQRNADLARLVVSRPEHTLVIVGWTNRRALLQGAADGPGKVMCFENRDKATEAVSERLKEHDVVLYENDLPDHYA